MKKLLLMLFVGCLFISGAPQVKNNVIVSTRSTSSDVLVQLFTSQGCSSCPPADKLLGQMSDKYQGKDVYFLAYHVDYWDRLGWKDPFSQKKFTQKQYKYASTFNLNSVYTPQAVVNGTYQFTGSDSAGMQTAITRSSGGNAVTRRLTLSLSVPADKSLKVDYSANDLQNGEKIYLALYLKKVVTVVAKGENRGRDLTNFNTVLAEKDSPKAEGNIAFSIPENMDVQDMSILGYIQGDDQKITAVSPLKIPKMTSK